MPFVDHPAMIKVDDAIRISPIVLNELEAYRIINRTRFEFARRRDDHLNYNQNDLRPYGELIFMCIPACATSYDELPEGRADTLRPHVVAYMEKAVSRSHVWILLRH